MKLTKHFSVLALSAGMFAAHAESELSVSAVDTFQDGSTTYASVSIALNNTGNINTLAFDMVVPAGLAYDGTECTTRTQVSKRGTLTDTWSPAGMAHEGFVSVTANGKDDNQLEPGTGDVFVVYFVVSDGATFSAEDFMFNNASAALGATRDEVKFPIGRLGSNGYSSYSSTQDVVIEGATAYYGVLNSETLELKSVAEGEAVYHGKGVVLKGTEGEMVYGKSVETAIAPDADDLVATGAGVDVSPNTVHVLATVANITGFYSFTGTHIGAGKSYLNGASGARISFDYETGIESLSEDRSGDFIFNLQGQKQTEFQSGFSIVNGKIIMLK